MVWVSLDISPEVESLGYKKIIFSFFLIYPSSIFSFFKKHIYWLCYYSCPISPPSLHSILSTPSLPHSPPIVIAAIFTIAKIWKQPMCPSGGEWINKLCYIYTMEYYPPVKNKKILPFVKAWMDLENIMLGDIATQRKRNTIWS